MGHERFRSSHFYEWVVSLHGESGGLKIRRERVGTVTTHLAPWSNGKDAHLRFAPVVAKPTSTGCRATFKLEKTSSRRMDLRSKLSSQVLYASLGKLATPQAPQA